MSTPEVTAVELEKFLKGHHHAAKDTRSSQVVQVFAIAGHPVFGDERSSYDFDIEFGFAGLTWILRGSINLSTLSISASFLVRIPLLGTITLASLNGSLLEGVSVTFGISGILSGTAKFYVRDKWLYVDLSATVFGSTYGPITIGLIPLPI
ncbi:hypothetical protein BJV74DRAFT_990920 [Russula compacta]|nr:hypothetical protein BJV74DRAFT_990920 [Russula compacta]